MNLKLWLLIDNKEVEKEVKEYNGSGMYEGHKVVGGTGMFRQIKGNGTLYRVEKDGAVIDLTNKELEQLIQEIYEIDRETMESVTGMDLLRVHNEELEDEVERLQSEVDDLQEMLDA